MAQTANTTEILDDLVKINNDRIIGYQKAIKELHVADSDLKAIFESMIAESQAIKDELEAENSLTMTDAQTDIHNTTTSGKLYRAWMDVKAVFTGHDRKAILTNCEFGEDAAQRAYRDALNDNGLVPELQTIIRDQQARLRVSHDKIKTLRDLEF